MTTEITPNEPPTVTDIRRERLSKLWLKCPECGTVHERWPKEMKESDGIPENKLIDEVLDCYLSHDWTPDSWEEAHEQGLVPESWVEQEQSSLADHDDEEDEGLEGDRDE